MFSILFITILGVVCGASELKLGDPCVVDDSLGVCTAGNECDGNSQYRDVYCDEDQRLICCLDSHTRPRDDYSYRNTKSTDNHPSIPGRAFLILQKTIYSIVEINEKATSYKNLVNRKNSVHIPLKWITSQDSATYDFAKIFLNGTEIWSGNNTIASTTIGIKESGDYVIQILLCNYAGCSLGKPTNIVVADTDGKHLSFPNIIGADTYFRQVSEKVIAVTYLESNIGIRNYPIDKIPIKNITHLLYYHIIICGGESINDALKYNQDAYNILQNSCSESEDFEVSVFDTWSAIKRPQNKFFSKDEIYKGNFGQLMLLKQKQPDLKIIPVVGSWDSSDPFIFIDDETKMNRFVKSMTEFLRTWKFFDGVTLYLSGEKLKQKIYRDSSFKNTFIRLMKKLRDNLNMLSRETGKKYEVNSIINGNWQLIEAIDLKNCQNYIDYIFLNNFDYYGPWDLSPLGHHSPLYASQWNPKEKYNANYIVKLLLNQEVDASKIIVGVAAYGRGWSGVKDFTSNYIFSGKASGPLKKEFSVWVPDYKEIAEEISSGKWETHYDRAAQAPYIFQPTGNLITYDNPRSAVMKAEYVRQNSLGGLFLSDIGGDNGDLLNAINVGVGNTQSTDIFPIQLRMKLLK